WQSATPESKVQSDRWFWLQATPDYITFFLPTASGRNSTQNGEKAQTFLRKLFSSYVLTSRASWKPSMCRSHPRVPSSNRMYGVNSAEFRTGKRSRMENWQSGWAIQKPRAL